jgi:hypothetical protein
MTLNSTLNRGFPTLRYLLAPFRWIFGSRRRMATVAAVLLAIIAAPPLWWSIQLFGLPDIGEPFDRAEFRSFRIPDDSNAFVLFGQATALLKPLPVLRDPSDRPIDPLARWSKADPSVRRWADENREAMTLCRRGAERPDALGLNPQNNPKAWELLQALRSFHILSLLEASRLEQQGDMAGAWDWYRAGLRATYQTGLRAPSFSRVLANRWQNQLRDRLAAWCVDRRTTPALVRQALDEVIACGALVPSETYTLKADFAEMEEVLNDPRHPYRGTPPPWTTSIASVELGLSSEQLQAIQDPWRFWRRETERSRRVIRLAVANWLAYHDLPPERRPEPDPNISSPFEFYAFGPEAPANARALSPEALDRWLETTTDARAMLRDWNSRAIRVKEQSSHRALVLLLASELYRRERGADPPSDEALVGPYLKSLPDDGLEDQRRAPTSSAGER